jgi:hypothetical protein
MTDDGLSKEMLFGSVTGSARRSRPMKTWNECVGHDLEHIGKTYSW